MSALSHWKSVFLLSYIIKIVLYLQPAAASCVKELAIASQWKLLLHYEVWFLTVCWFTVAYAWRYPIWIKRNRSKLSSLYNLYRVLWLLGLNNYDSYDFLLLNHYYFKQGQPSCQEDFQSEIVFPSWWAISIFSKGSPHVRKTSNQKWVLHNKCSC